MLELDRQIARFFDRPGFAQRGFTLIEMTMVIIIFGIIVAAFAGVYTQYINHQRSETTRINVNNLASALGNFRTMYGRYPCPASLTEDRNSVTYGRETDCKDSVVPVGTCLDGICVEESTREIDPGTGAFKPRVRIGFAPFRELGLDEDEVYDGFGRRLFYVVTERQAVAATFSAQEGGIEITNEAGNSILAPPGSAHFITFSAGKNQGGSYGKNGDLIPCPLVGPEAQNCTPNDKAIYTVGQISEASGANSFDDIFKYSTSEDIPLWQASDVDPLDIHQKPGGRVGLAAGATTALTDSAEIAGVVRIQDDATTAQQEGVLRSNSVCDISGQRCFATNKISGLLAQNEGMSCPQGQFMKGIQDGNPICQTEVILRCPSNGVMTGIDAQGNIVCITDPPANCTSQSVAICTGSSASTTRVLPARNHGTTFTISAGASYQQTFQCTDGSWISQGSTGVCACTEVTETQNASCGVGYTGTHEISRTYQCPQGQWTPWTPTGTVVLGVGSTCVCEEFTEYQNLPCANGFTGAGISRLRERTCNPTAWGPWEEISNDCTCTNSTETRSLQCPTGFVGAGITESRSVTCGSPPTYGSWTEQSRDCTCQQIQDYEETFPCPSGYEGEIVKTRDFLCPDAQWTSWTEVSNTCQPIPPVVCSWTSVGSGTESPFRIGQARGSQCSGNSTCGSYGPCWESFGPNNYRVYESCFCN